MSLTVEEQILLTNELISDPKALGFTAAMGLSEDKVDIEVQKLMNKTDVDSAPADPVPASTIVNAIDLVNDWDLLTVAGKEKLTFLCSQPTVDVGNPKFKLLIEDCFKTIDNPSRVELLKLTTKKISRAETLIGRKASIIDVHVARRKI